MSKYNLSELLTEVAGGRIGTLNISARDLVSKMEDLEDKGVKIDRFDGLSPDGKTYLEFHVHPMRKYDEDSSFSIYDFKFGFNPMSEDHFMEEYPFSIGGRSSALDSAETVLRSGDVGYQIDEDAMDNVMNVDKVASPDAKAHDYGAEIKGISDEDDTEEAYAHQTVLPLEEDKDKEPRDGVKSAAAKLGMKPSHVKENMSKKDSLKKEMIFHLDQLMDGNIDMEDFMNVVEEIMLDVKIAAKDEELEARLAKEVMGIDRKGNKKPDTDGSDATKFKKAAMSEAQYAPEVVDRIEMARKALWDTNKFDDKEIEVYIKSLVRDFNKGDFEAYDDYEADDYVEDMNNYIADKALQEHFKRFI